MRAIRGDAGHRVIFPERALLPVAVLRREYTYLHHRYIVEARVRFSAALCILGWLWGAIALPLKGGLAVSKLDEIAARRAQGFRWDVGPSDEDHDWLIARVRKLETVLTSLTEHCCCVIPPDDGEDECSNPDCVSLQARQALKDN